MAPRFTWRETPRGNWICEHGAYTAVLELRSDGIGIRIKLPDDTVIAFDADEDIPAFSKIEVVATVTVASVTGTLRGRGRQHRPDNETPHYDTNVVSSMDTYRAREAAGHGIGRIGECAPTITTIRAPRRHSASAACTRIGW